MFLQIIEIICRTVAAEEIISTTKSNYTYKFEGKYTREKSLVPLEFHMASD